MIDGEIARKSAKGRRKVPIPAILRDHLDALTDAGPLFGDPGWIARTNGRAPERWEARDSYLAREVGSATVAHTVARPAQLPV